MKSENSMDVFLKNCFPGKAVHKVRMAGDGGHREYFRLKAENHSYVLMSSGEKDPSLKIFVRIRKTLQDNNLPAPRIFYQDLKKGFLVLEDLGDITLAAVQNAGRKQALRLYQKALDDMIHFQLNVSFDDGFPFIGKRCLLNETQTALRRLETLAHTSCGRKISDTQKERFLQESDRLCDCISAFLITPCHRDFHSRNLMVKNERLYWIDFQDGGRGPYCYDLCSLIYDSYISLKESKIKDLIEYYFLSLPPAFRKRLHSPEQIHKEVRVQFLQRGLKACGCFAAFYNNEGRTSHLRFIRPTLKALEREAKALSFKQTAAYARSLQKRLGSPAFRDLEKN